MIKHPFKPVVDSDCTILILGSFPSVASRANAFYYGNRQNRFWKVLSAVLGQNVPDTIEGKKCFLLEHHIALWDVLAGCDITGSADATIQNALVNDIGSLVKQYPIKKIFFNGTAAYELFIKLNKQSIPAAMFKMPSTSPSNAAYNLEKLVLAWQVIKTEKAD